MLLKNFTIKGDYLQVVGRVVSKVGTDDSTVYDIEFPDDIIGMSIEDLRIVVGQLEADLSSLFYYNKSLRDSTIQKFEETWNPIPKDGDADAH